jgi:hypothetical protein
MRLPSLSDANSKHASAYADEVIRVAHDGLWHYREVAPLGGLELDPIAVQGFNEAGILVRRIAEDEAIDWLEHVDFYHNYQKRDDLPLLALEVHTSSPRRATQPEMSHSAPVLAAALELTGQEIAGRFTAQRLDPVWISPLVSEGELAVPRATGQINMFEEKDFRLFLDMTARLARYAIDEPRSTADLALHRFVSGCARPIPADALIDFTIALESLLLPYDEAARRSDLSYRFRIHGAHYLAHDAAERVELFKKLRTIYDMRSRLVHGGHYPTTDETVATRDIARDLARRGLQRAIRHGFPTAQAFNEMALGAD